MSEFDSPAIPGTISLAAPSALPLPGAVMASSFAGEKFVSLNQVRSDPELTPLAFMLAYVLADLVNEWEGYAWPGIAHLAAECHVTGKGVRITTKAPGYNGIMAPGIPE
jgi:hypothetical protein